jgi:hypothetical protein
MAGGFVKFATAHSIFKRSVCLWWRNCVVHDEFAQQTKVVFSCADQVSASQILNIFVGAVNNFLG